MSKSLLLEVDKECNICKHVNVPEYSEQLMCNLTLKQVDDNHTCEEFEVCKEIFTDLFFNIKGVRDG